MAANTTHTHIKHTGSVMSLAMNSDGSRLYSGGVDGHLLMWDTTTHTVVEDVKCERAVWHVIEDEGVLYAEVSDSAVMEVDGMTGNIIATYAKTEGSVKGFALRDGLFRIYSVFYLLQWIILTLLQ